MYAIIFDIDSNCVNDQNQNNSISNCYEDVHKFMEANHFIQQQVNLFLGDETVNAVSCVLTIQKLVKQYPWLDSCIKDARMLRIEENSDLLIAIK